MVQCNRSVAMDRKLLSNREMVNFATLGRKQKRTCRRSLFVYRLVDRLNRRTQSEFADLLG
jgi:hypothetical protein